MTYLALIREDNEGANNTQDGPVQKTGLRLFHEQIARRVKGKA